MWKYMNMEIDSAELPTMDEVINRLKKAGNGDCAGIDHRVKGVAAGQVQFHQGVKSLSGRFHPYFGKHVVKPPLFQGRRQVDGCGGFAHSPFLVGDGNDFPHSLPLSSLIVSFFPA